MIESKGSKVLVAGASGQTGSRVLSQLRTEYPGVTAVAGVRIPQKLPAGTTSVKLDVTDDSTFSAAFDGCDAVICAVCHTQLTHFNPGAPPVLISMASIASPQVGFVPGNPLKMGAAAHAVDNVGTIALIDAAKAAGVKKFVLVSSILTDGRSWGQVAT